MSKLKVLHASLEAEKGVGGIKSVVRGLLPALARKGGLEVSIVTPFYDVYNGFYHPMQIQRVAKLKHIYKGKIFESVVFRACNTVIDEANKIYHYLIRPIDGSDVAWLFNIKDERSMYQAFPWSEPQNRLEYFNSAIASMVRTPSVNIPEFDILHTHTWHAGLSACLIKEFENLPHYRDLIQVEPKRLNKIPHIISTIHMLLIREQGQLTATTSVKALIDSVGLPADFAQRFPHMPDYFKTDHLKQVALALVYSDFVTAVSRGLAKEMIEGKGEGLDDLFVKLHKEERLQGITNGITLANFDGTLERNLGEFAFKPGIRSVSADKDRLKHEMARLCPTFAPNKITYIFIARLAEEKGMKVLIDVAKAIGEIGGNFIVFGMHVVYVDKEGRKVPRYQDLVDELRTMEHVLVFDTPESQRQIANVARGCVDYVGVFSTNEACGLPTMELKKYGVRGLAAKIQGLPDSVTPFNADGTQGTGFLYTHEPEDHEQLVKNIRQAIFESANFDKQQRQAGTLDNILVRIIQDAEKHDWDALPSAEYVDLYTRVAKRPLLTFDQIRKIDGELSSSVSLPMVQQFKRSRTVGATKPRIFQVGFNKCGSVSLYQLLTDHGLATVHYHSGNLATRMYDNSLNGVAIIPAQYRDCVGFCDMENIYDPRGPIYIAQRLFKELDQQNPGSLFVLNTRSDVEKWIASRAAHVDLANNQKYTDVLCEKYGISLEDLKTRWRIEWREHHAAVLKHFENRPESLLVMNIDEADHILEFCERVKQLLGVDLDPSKYKHLNKTNPSLTV